MLSLVTGGAGFLGSHLVDALIAGGNDVIIADNLCTGSVSNLERALTGARATFVHIDVAQPVEVLRGPLRAAARAKRIERIFHLASPAVHAALSWETLAVNGLGTMALIEFALEEQSRFIFASTAQTDGDPPAGEADGKRFGEAAVAAAVAQRGLDARIVRLRNCYGPRMSKADSRLIAAFAEASAAGLPLPRSGDADGWPPRSMTFVDDAIRLLLAVAAAPQRRLVPVDIGCDREGSAPETPQTSQTTLADGLAKTLSWLRQSEALYA